jgi:hypothetical protein
MLYFDGSNPKIAQPYVQWANYQRLDHETETILEEVHEADGVFFPLTYACHNDV